MSERYPGVARACFHLNWIFLAVWTLYLLGPDVAGVLPIDRLRLDEADEFAAQSSVAIDQVAGRDGVRIAQKLSDLAVHHADGIAEPDRPGEIHDVARAAVDRDADDHQALAAVAVVQAVQVRDDHPAG